MKRIPLKKTTELLDRPVRLRRGVGGFRDWKFFAVLALQFAALVLLLRDPWFGVNFFEGEAGITLTFLALIIVASFAWEELLFGAPRGFNLLLHCTFLAPFTLFLVRVMDRSPATQPGDSLFAGIRSTFGAIDAKLGITELVPRFLPDLFTNPWPAFAAAAVLLAFCFRRPAIRFGIVAVLLILSTAAALSAPEGDNRCFIPAALALLLAAGLQFCPYRKVVLYCNLIRAIEPLRDEARFRASLVLLTTLARDGVIPENRLLALFRGTLPEVSSDELHTAVSEQLHLLIGSGLVELHSGNDGVRLSLSPRAGATDSLLAGIAIWPRMVFLSLFALLWVLSPIDLIPDAVPLFGALDDAAITILAAAQFRRAVNSGRAPDEP